MAGPGVTGQAGRGQPATVRSPVVHVRASRGSYCRGVDITAGTVVCVVVTRDRTEQLRRAVAAIREQSRRPDHLVVVDNGPDAAVEAIGSSSGVPLTYLPSSTNLGGAGGFALGILTARALGADWVWLADDDGRPADRWTLARLLVCAREHRLAAVSPLVVDIDDPQQLAFPLRRGLRWVRGRDELGHEVLIDGPLGQVVPRVTRSVRPAPPAKSRLGREVAQVPVGALPLHGVRGAEHHDAPAEKGSPVVPALWVQVQGGRAGAEA